MTDLTMYIVKDSGCCVEVSLSRVEEGDCRGNRKTGEGATMIIWVKMMA